MNLLRWVLMLLAVICFLAAAFEIRTPRINPVGLGLALWSFATLLGMAVQ